jgi:antitoxin MazE
MAYLVKIGNSQGIRIPKPLIEQAHLEGKELQLQVVNGGLFIAPIKRTTEVS